MPIHRQVSGSDPCSVVGGYANYRPLLIEMDRHRHQGEAEGDGNFQDPDHEFGMSNRARSVAWSMMFV
jgi:hypothetical protein